MLSAVLALSVQFAVPVHADSYAARIRSVTHLREGTYQLSSGPKSCAKGVLTVKDQKKGALISLGSQTLAEQVGPATSKLDQDECQVQFKGDYGDGYLVQSEDQDCEGERTRRSVNITVQNDGFTYVETDGEGAKTTCVLKLR